MNAVRRVITMVILAAIVGCVPPASSPTGTSGGQGAPFGGWTVTITPNDFQAAGLTDAAGIAENIGTYTFTVNEDGTFTEAQQTEEPIRWPVFRGTWSETGPGMIGLRTTFPADYEGEYIAIGWSIDADGLHLRLISPPEPALKVHFETRPWSPVP